MLEKKLFTTFVVILSSFFIVFAFPKHTFAQTCNTGDGNGDGLVDGFDYVIWWQNFNKNVQGAQNGDFNCDGYVDGFDYVIWWQNFGSVGNTPTPGNRIRITYSESNEDFANPERGFMMQSNIHVDKAFSPSKIDRKQASDSVVWVYFHLENYRDPRDGKGVNLPDYQGKLLESIGSGKGLDTVNKTFQEARKKGLKLVIRFLYVGYPGIGSTSSNPEPDMPIEWVNKHADQLRPLLQNNKDVIAAVQTGFVGYWGEWHSSKYLNPLDKRHAVIDTVLAMTPSDRMIQLRYPRYKQPFYGGPLTDSQAYNQTPIARIGHHNDAFLRDANDGGTFKSTQYGIKATNYCDNYPGGENPCWRDYVNKDSRFVPVGGEAGTHSSTPSQYADCSNALTQLSSMHWSFIHNGYSKVTLNHWVNQGCMPEIRRRLGYRIVLKEALIPRSIKPGGSINLDVTLTNKGFAAMYNPRPVYLVLEGPGRYEILLPSVDPRRWVAGVNSTMSVNVNVPSNVVAGTYKLGLWLPDAASSLRNNTAYAVRFANTNVWNASSGVNFLTNSIQVQAKTAVLSKTTTATFSLKQLLEKWLVPTLDQNGDGRLDLLDVTLTF